MQGAFCNVASHRSKGKGRVRWHSLTAEEAEALGNPDPPVGATICCACRVALQREAKKRAKLRIETCGGCGMPGKNSATGLPS